MSRVAVAWLALPQRRWGGGMWKLAPLKLYQDIGRFMFPVVTPTVIHWNQRLVVSPLLLYKSASYTPG